MSGQTPIGDALGAAAGAGILGSLAVTGEVIVNPFVGFIVSFLIVLTLLVFVPKVLAKIVKK